MSQNCVKKGIIANKTNPFLFHSFNCTLEALPGLKKLRMFFHFSHYLKILNLERDFKSLAISVSSKYCFKMYGQ